MPHATETDVLEIIDTALTAAEVTPFLAAATALVTDVCAGSGYAEDLLLEIERWLAAHFLCLRDPRVVEEDLGIGRWKYEAGAAPSAEGLRATRYGQQVLMLDYRGNFASIASQKGTASISVVDFRTSP